MENKELKEVKKNTNAWDRDGCKKAKHAENTEQTEITSGKSLEEMVDDLLRAIGFDIDPDDEGPFELSQRIEKKTKKDVEDKAIERHQEALSHRVDMNGIVNQGVQKQLDDMKAIGDQIKEDLNKRLASELQLGNLRSFEHKMRASKGQF